MTGFAGDSQIVYWCSFCCAHEADAGVVETADGVTLYACSECRDSPVLEEFGVDTQ